MNLANKLSGLDDNIYNNADEDGLDHRSDSDSSYTEQGRRGRHHHHHHRYQGPEQPRRSSSSRKHCDNRSIAEKGCAPGVVNAESTRVDDDKWEVVPPDPDFYVIPSGNNVRDLRAARQPEASLNADWVVCEKGRNGEVQMLEGPPPAHDDLASLSSSTSAEEREIQKTTSVSRPGSGDSDTTQHENRASARPDPKENASQMTASDSRSGAARRVVVMAAAENQTLPSPLPFGQAPTNRTQSNQAPLSGRSYERIRPVVNRIPARPVHSTTAAGGEARQDQQQSHPPHSAPVRIPTANRIARPRRNPNFNRPFPAHEEKELPFLAPMMSTAAAAAAAAAVGGPEAMTTIMSRQQQHDHRQIAAQLRAQAVVAAAAAASDQEYHHVAAPMAEQHRMDNRLEREEGAAGAGAGAAPLTTKWYGLPHGRAPHFD
ncbi:hypothetical protein AYL99_04975 [Fonsecaea erecta]|uniref:Uncharacterized protein n=1 Tax=Fonsecaea erecta TaxID=1367422 RepID=A0A178ZL83_9EURO|nr:hypothetical protein AYL99_04975 [Fonsecaea erecta]OAP59973.1 hypothetical protein AYL99_04975 [Fonsecaea erecta]